ncbi:MAG: hypothetical protein ABJC66_14285 [Gammaproteobacteria bacterium]
MKKSSSGLLPILSQLSSKARSLGLTDAEWAARAGVRKETLSRLRGRTSCDFATLEGLAQSVGATLCIVEAHAMRRTDDGLFPAQIDRDYEERLTELCSSGDLDPEHWRCLGPPFFMAGLAVMLASVPEFDRRALLEVAENLHAGSSQVGVFSLWLEGSPIRPSRFLPRVTRNRAAA